MHQIIAFYRLMKIVLSAGFKDLQNQNSTDESILQHYVPKMFYNISSQQEHR